MSARLDLAYSVAATRREGPGLRRALWVRGCTIRCPGCCNPELFERRGEGRLVSDLLAELDAGPEVEGVSMLGGEPLEQIEGVLAFAKGAQTRGLGVIVFTGYELDGFEHRRFEALRRYVDTFVDGPFDARRLEPSLAGRPHVGSTNQRLIHLSDRYSDPASWSGPRSAELRREGPGRIEIHGDPELSRLLRRVMSRPA